MINIMSKRLFFLLFLFVSTATYCMEQENKNAEFSLNDPKDRVELTQALIETVPAIQYFFYYENHKRDDLPKYLLETKKDKPLIINGYSLLAFTAIAIRAYPLGKNYPEYAPYEKRKELIKDLRKSGRIPNPTPKDREVALIIEKEAGRARNDGKSDLFDE